MGVRYSLWVVKEIFRLGMANFWARSTQHPTLIVQSYLNHHVPLSTTPKLTKRFENRLIANHKRPGDHDVVPEGSQHLEASIDVAIIYSGDP